MKRITVVLWLVVACLVCVSAAFAATAGDAPPIMTNGAVNVTTAAAIAVPTTCTKGTNTFIIYNNGPNTIWCGRVNNVSNTTGFPVCTGCSLNVDITCPVNTARFYCRADTADQVSPANTRYLEVK